MENLLKSAFSTNLETTRKVNHSLPRGVKRWNITIHLKKVLEETPASGSEDEDRAEVEEGNA